MKILIVEDAFLSRQVLCKFLSGYGDCDIAVNGKEAVEAFKMAIENEKYDLVCLDVMMPEMDGHEALTEIRAIEAQKGVTGLRGVKIIMTTALGDSKNILKAFKEQCESYLVKPITKDKLHLELKKLGLVSG